MPSDFLTFIIYLLGVFLLIRIANALRLNRNWPAETTRKLLHVSVGILVASTPFIFASKIPPILLALIFIGVNFLSVKYHLFKGMEETRRETYGTVFFPIAYLILVLLCWERYQEILVISILVMALADTAAALVGKRYGAHPYHFTRERKSVEGTVAMFIVTVLVVFFSLMVSSKHSIAERLWTALVVGVIAMVVESLSSYGSDNLTIPLSVSFVLFLMLNATEAMRTSFTLGLALAGGVAILSYRAAFLSGSGAVATFLMGTIIFGIGQLKWSCPMLTFFILSSLLSKVGRRQKEKLNAIFEKSGPRDMGQVLNNGGIPTASLLLNFFFPHLLWFRLYLSMLAAVTADTWGTEIGTLFNHSPRQIPTFKKVPPGTSGGITLPGTIGALVGALVIATSGLPFLKSDASLMREFLLIAAVGFLGSGIDSLLGATVQGQYRCPKCLKVTEKRMHCVGVEPHLTKGLKWIDNDGVNLLCSLSGGVLFYLASKWW